MPTITCKCGCKRKKEVRQADLDRGWGLFYSKSCKAKEQEKRTGQHAKYKNKVARAKRVENMSDEEYYNSTVHPFSSEGHGQE